MPVLYSGHKWESSQKWGFGSGGVHNAIAVPVDLPHPNLRNPLRPPTVSIVRAVTKRGQADRP